MRIDFERPDPPDPPWWEEEDAEFAVEGGRYDVSKLGWVVGWANGSLEDGETLVTSEPPDINLSDWFDEEGYYTPPPSESFAPLWPSWLLSEAVLEVP